MVETGKALEVQTGLGIADKSDVIKLAISRIQARKRANPAEPAEKAEPAGQPEPQGESQSVAQKIEKFCENPTTYQQFAVAFLCQHKKEVVAAIVAKFSECLPSAEIKSSTMEDTCAQEILYPAVADQLLFKKEDGWNNKDFTLSTPAAGRFIYDTLGGLLADCSKQFLKWRMNARDVYRYKNRKGELSAVDHSTATCPCFEKALADELSEFEPPFDGYGQITLRRLIDHIRGLITPEDSGDRYDIGENFGKVGTYIYRGLTRHSIPGEVRKCRRGDASLEPEVARVVDEMIYKLSGINPDSGQTVVAKKTTSVVDADSQASKCLPDFSGLEHFRRQLSVHAQRLAIRNRLFEIIELEERELKHHPDKEAVEKLKFFKALQERLGQSHSLFNLYKNARFVNPMPGCVSKRSIKKDLDKEKLHFAIEAVYAMIEYSYRLYMVGLGYAKNGGGNEKLRRYGEIFMEVASIHMERVSEMAVGIDMQSVMGTLEGDANLVKKLFALAGVPTVEETLQKSGLFAQLQEIDAVWEAVGTREVRSTTLSGTLPEIPALEAPAAVLVEEASGEGDAPVVAREPKKIS